MLTPHGVWSQYSRRCSEPARSSTDSDVENSIRSLTEAVKELRQQDLPSPSDSLPTLLIEAQEELDKLTFRCLRAPGNRCPDICPDEDEWGEGSPTAEQRTTTTEEDDLALLENIPLQSLLGACFEQQTRKKTPPSSGRVSDVSTMASLGGSSMHASASPSVSTRPTMPCFSANWSTASACDARTAATVPRHNADNMRYETSCPSPRDSLPCIGSHRHRYALDGETLPQFPKFLTKYEYNSGSPQVGVTSPKSPSLNRVGTNGLVEVEPVPEDEDDAWELEFLKRAQCD